MMTELIDKARLLQEIELRKKIWQRLKNPRKITKPAFVVGSGRSGTSMLIFQLAKSWEIDLYNENHPKAFRNWRLRNLSEIEGLVEQSSARITLFKPILNTPQTPDLLVKFPDSKILFAFRHYHDVINSSIKKFGLLNRLDHVRKWIEEDFSEFSHYPPPETTKEAICSLWLPELGYEDGAALYWLFYNRLFLDLNLDQEERVLLVKYEAVVSQPEAEFKRICEFLELSFESKMIEGIHASSIHRDSIPTLDSRIENACNLVWLNLCARTSGDCNS